MTTKRWAIIVLMLVAVAVGVWAAARFARRSGPSADPTRRRRPSLLHAVPAGDKLTLRFFRDPSPAPAVAMRDIDGKSISSTDLRGKVVLVNFWATWCPPCRAEIPDLVALQEKYGDRLQIIGVSQDEGLDRVGQALRRRAAA